MTSASEPNAKDALRKFRKGEFAEAERGLQNTPDLEALVAQQLAARNLPVRYKAAPTLYDGDPLQHIAFGTDDTASNLSALAACLYMIRDAVEKTTVVVQTGDVGEGGSSVLGNSRVFTDYRRVKVVEFVLGHTDEIPKSEDAELFYEALGLVEDKGLLTQEQADNFRHNFWETASVETEADYELFTQAARFKTVEVADGSELLIPDPTDRIVVDHVADIWERQIEGAKTVAAMINNVRNEAVVDVRAADVEVMVSEVSQEIAAPPKLEVVSAPIAAAIVEAAVKPLQRQYLSHAEEVVVAADELIHDPTIGLTPYEVARAEVTLAGAVANDLHQRAKQRRASTTSVIDRPQVLDAQTSVTYAEILQRQPETLVVDTSDVTEPSIPAAQVASALYLEAANKVVVADRKASSIAVEGQSVTAPAAMIFEDSTTARRRLETALGYYDKAIELALPLALAEHSDAKTQNQIDTAPNIQAVKARSLLAEELLARAQLGDQLEIDPQLVETDARNAAALFEEIGQSKNGRRDAALDLVNDFNGDDQTLDTDEDGTNKRRGKVRVVEWERVLTITTLTITVS